MSAAAQKVAVLYERARKRRRFFVDYSSSLRPSSPRSTRVGEGDEEIAKIVGELKARHDRGCRPHRGGTRAARAPTAGAVDP